MPNDIRYYTDENVRGAIVQGLRRRGMDVLSSPEARTLGFSDEEQLNYAVQANRVIFTEDCDFVTLVYSRSDHAGIVFAPQGRTIRQCINGLLFIHAMVSASEMRGRLEIV